MQHVNPDTLALLALGEDVATAEERTHLDDCSECRARLGELADAAAVGRTVIDLERLAVPPDRVWDAIARELRLTDEDAPPRSIALLDRPAAGERPADAADQVAPPRRRRARRLLLALAAVVVLLVAGTAGTVALLHAGDPTVVARADLKHLPGWSGSSGRAEIDQYADGRRVVVVTTNLRPSASAGHEVWLMDAATGSRIGLGFLKGPSGAFVLPKRVDLATYSNIDVSAEPHDGDPAPSGPSIIRGPLES
jgi:predicted anti-sigma-YlaC factor YlaD